MTPNELRLKGLKGCLWDIFANPETTDFKSQEYWWALDEAVARFVERMWQIQTAVKTHECQMGHTINPGEPYCRQGGNGGWGTGLKLCARCSAMALYFADADKYEPMMFTHWSYEENHPVTIGSSRVEKAFRAAHAHDRKD